MWTKPRALLAAVVAGSIAVSATADAADGRYCERRTSLCWDCADISFPAAIPCADASACTALDLCVDQDAAPACLPSTYVCCDQAPCERPPQCPDPANSCGGDGGTNAYCTFLSSCPAMDASVRPDGAALDAGADAGADGSPSDASASDAASSDGSPFDASGGSSPPPSADSGASTTRPEARDGAADDAGTLPAEDGCSCDVAGGTGTPVGAVALAALALAAVTRRRRPRG